MYFLKTINYLKILRRVYPVRLFFIAVILIVEHEGARCGCSLFSKRSRKFQQFDFFNSFWFFVFPVITLNYFNFWRKNNFYSEIKRFHFNPIKTTAYCFHFCLQYGVKKLKKIFLKTLSISFNSKCFRFIVSLLPCSG